MDDKIPDITGVPSFLFFQGDRLINKVSGADKNKILSILNNDFV